MKLQVVATTTVDTDDLTQQERKELVVQTLGYEHIRRTLFARQVDLFPGKLLWEHTLRRLAAPATDLLQ